MKVIWSTKAWSDWLYWTKHDPKIAQKITNLVGDIARSPFTGLGKPEPLKADLADWWARRITDDHRLVYRIVGKRGADQRLEILQSRFHY